MKAKDLVEAKVSENGKIEKPTLQQELESIKEQYNDAINKQQQYANLGQRCLGAIEILERIEKDNV